MLGLGSAEAEVAAEQLPRVDVGRRVEGVECPPACSGVAGSRSPKIVSSHARWEALPSSSSDRDVPIRSAVVVQRNVGVADPLVLADEDLHRACHVAGLGGSRESLVSAPISATAITTPAFEGEVVEHGLVRDAGRSSDVGERDVLEGVVEEQLLRLTHDRLPRGDHRIGPGSHRVRPRAFIGAALNQKLERESSENSARGMTGSKRRSCHPASRSGTRRCSGIPSGPMMLSIQAWTCQMRRSW